MEPGKEVAVSGNGKADEMMDDADLNRKRGLGTMAKVPAGVGKEGQLVGALVNQFEVPLSDKPPPASPHPKHDQKRMKKHGIVDVDSHNSGSAASQVEDRRDQ
jgi:hypothetical protein